VRGNIKSFEKPFTHAEVVALAERTLKRFGGDRSKAGRYARSMENRYESSKWAQVVEVLATSRSHATKKMTKAERLSIIKAARQASHDGDHRLAAVLFGTVGISYAAGQPTGSPPILHATKKSPAQLEREIAESLRAKTYDYATPADEIAQIAADALEEGRREMHQKIIERIPPIRLGRTLYRVLHGRSVSGGGHLTIQGPRGGISHLVPSTNDPSMVAHNMMGGKTTRYRRNADGTYTALRGA
jgi:hypothetical protein